MKALTRRFGNPCPILEGHVSHVSDLVLDEQYNHAMEYLLDVVPRSMKIKVYAGVIATLGDKPDTLAFGTLLKFRRWVWEHGSIVVSK
jgi:hypothetical protein